MTGEVLLDGISCWNIQIWLINMSWLVFILFLQDVVLGVNWLKHGKYQFTILYYLLLRTIVVLNSWWYRIKCGRLVLGLRRHENNGGVGERGEISPPKIDLKIWKKKHILPNFWASEQEKRKNQ